MIDPLDIVTEGEYVSEYVVVSPTLSLFEVSPQVIELTKKEMRALLLPKLLLSFPGS